MANEWTLGNPVPGMPRGYRRMGERRELLEQAEKVLETAPGMLVPVILPPGVLPRRASQRLYQALYYARKSGKFMRLRVRIVKGQLYIGRLAEEEVTNVNGR